MINPQTICANFLLRRKKDADLKTFMTINKSFDDKIIGKKLINSNEAIAARNAVDEAFNNLCASHGEFAAATEGSWAEIAEYKPGYMGDREAL